MRRGVQLAVPLAALAAALVSPVGARSDVDPVPPPSWALSTLGPGGDYNALVVDAAGACHAAWFAGDSVVYSTNASGKWVTETVDTPEYGGGLTYSVAIAVDAQGQVHLAYDGTLRLRYALKSGSQWTLTTVHDPGVPGYDVGDDVSMDLDADGAAHVSYLDRRNGQLLYATNAGGSWAVTPLTSGGYMTSLDVDQDGDVHIAHWDWRGGNRILHTTNESGSWNTETVGASPNGYRPSLRVEGSRRIHVAWYDGDLRYAVNSGEGWSGSVVDDAVEQASNPSLAVDDAGNVHITYGEYGEGDLRYATNASGAWEWRPVDTAGDKGYSSSLAIDGDGLFHVVYGSRDEDPVTRYATNRATVDCKPVASRDGWIRETALGSGVGRARNSAGATFAVGDDAVGCQVRSILTFDTRGIPDGATVVGAELLLTRKPQPGDDPFPSHGPLLVDVGGPVFGASSAMKPEDFGAPAAVESAAEIPSAEVEGRLIGRLGREAASRFDVEGMSQLRLRFELPTDADGVADRAVFFAGSARPASRRPVLRVVYRRP